MATFDLPLDQLRTYDPEPSEPAGFDDFWARTLAEGDERDLDAVFTPVDARLRLLETLDVAFTGAGGTRVRGWLVLPRGADGPLPCVVTYIGYGGGRGLVQEWTTWASAGFAQFVMDTRGQGSEWSVGDTPDDAASGPQNPGFMTRGINDPHDHYYRRVYVDGVRAVAAARSHPGVDASRVFVTGRSQGGAITLAVAGLLAGHAPEGAPPLLGAMPDVPFLSHFRRAVDVSDAYPYQELVHHLRVHRGADERVFATLDHFDVRSFGARSRVPALFSVGLRDEITPPSTVFAAYHRYAGEKSIEVYPWNGHEGGEARQVGVQLAWASARAGLDGA